MRAQIVSVSTRYAGTPNRSATSRRRFEFEWSGCRSPPQVDARRHELHRMPGDSASHNRCRLSSLGKSRRKRRLTQARRQLRHHRKRGLVDVGQLLRVRTTRRSTSATVWTRYMPPSVCPSCPHFRMALHARHHDLRGLVHAILATSTCTFGHQRTRRHRNPQAARGGLLLHTLRGPRARKITVEPCGIASSSSTKTAPWPRKVGPPRSCCEQSLAHVDRRSVQGKCTFDDLDSRGLLQHKTARLSEDNFHLDDSDHMHANRSG